MDSDSDNAAIEPERPLARFSQCLLLPGQWIWSHTPTVLRPAVGVTYYALVALLLGYVRVWISRLFGERSHIDWRYLGVVWASGVVAALAFGVVRIRIPVGRPSRPWILGMTASAAFWLTLSLVTSRFRPFTSTQDALVGILGITGFGIAGGAYLWWIHRD